MSLAQQIFSLQGASSLEVLSQNASELQRLLSLERAASIPTLFVEPVKLHVLFQEPLRRERLVRWKTRLAVQLSGLNGCRAISKVGEAVLYTVGREQNVNRLRPVFIVLTTEIERLCEEHRRRDAAFSGESDHYRFKNTAANNVAKALELGASKAGIEMPRSVAGQLEQESGDVTAWIKENIKLG